MAYKAHFATCLICGASAHRFQIHLKAHQISQSRYDEMFDYVPLVERIKDRSEVAPDGCWNYTGARSRSTGYGQIRFWGKKMPASRAMYQAFHNKILPKNVFVCHSCDNPCCVNPSHLWEGSQKENIRDMVIKNRGGGQFTPLIGNDAILKIREYKKLNRSSTNEGIGRIFGIRASTVSRILHHKDRYSKV